MGVGALDYQGLDPTQETVIATSLPASIQKSKNLRNPPSGLPSDIVRNTSWDIFFKSPNGTLQSRDIIVDDLGVRYQVTAPYWNSLGYKAECERLEI
jgi:hypothetical protein